MGSEGRVFLERLSLLERLPPQCYSFMTTLPCTRQRGHLVSEEAGLCSLLR